MALDFCKKDDYGCHLQKLGGFRYRTFFRGRKRACKSTAARRIIIKKSISRETSLQRDDDDDDDDDGQNLGFEKKRKLGCETIPVKKSQLCSGFVQKDLPLNSKIWSGEYSNKRSSKKEETGAGIRKSRDVISGCGSVDQYESLNVISRGTYGIVYRAQDKKTGEIVAMKEEFDGLSISSLREIDILKSLNQHPSIVEFKQVVVDDYDGVYLVMEYLEHDLKRYIMDVSEHHLHLSEVKWLMKQLLEGVKFLHDNRVMHRDLKPSNILINNRGRLKICDFGLSRRFGSTLGSYSPHVGTLWYRAPELLLGAKTYSSAIDMWSVGCIMAELLLKHVLFRGRQSELGQLETICRILGTPDEAVWPGFLSLPGANAQFVNQPYNLLRNEFAAADFTEAGFDLLNRFLTYDPAKRITAECALSHAWFQEY